MFAALLAGTFWGGDDHFPFGPFRMYAMTNKTDGRVSESVLQGRTVSGEFVRLGFDSFGLRRAELEGQIDRIEQHPELLRHVVTAYEHFFPDEPRLREVHLVEEIHDLEDGRVLRTEIKTVAVWRRG